LIDWKDRLAPGRPPLRPGEFATMVGWKYEVVRKLMSAGKIPGKAIVEGGERRIPVPFARETAISLGILVA
jgi:hypothetical protein